MVWDLVMWELAIPRSQTEGSIEVHESRRQLAERSL